MTQPDVIVIGGGIAGMSVAAELAADMRVLLLEAEAQPGYHATGRSAAIFIRNYGNATLRALNAAAAPYLEDPSHYADGPVLSPRGEMLVANEQELDALRDYTRDAEGLEHLSPQQAQELVPILDPDQIAGAAIEWDAQDIDVGRMLSGYRRLLLARAGKIRLKSPVRGLHRQDGLWQVQTDHDSFHAPLLVNAAGAWVEQIGQMAGAQHIGFQPLRRSAVMLPGPDNTDSRSWPMFSSAASNWYAKPDAGRLMVSPADADPVPPQDTWADDMVLAEGLDRFSRAVTLPITRIGQSWAGLRTFAPDRSPVLGFDSQSEGFFWLAGQGGYGVQTAPILARIAAQILSNQPSEVADRLLIDLSPTRFLKG